MIKKSRNFLVLLTTVIALSVPAALSIPTMVAAQGSVSRSQVGAGMMVREGKIIDVQSIQIEGKSGVGGTVAGGVIGNRVGNSIGGGSGRKVSRAVGTVAGAGIGRRAQNRATREEGLEIIVKLDDGNTIGVIQKRDGQYSIGQRVRVMNDRDGTFRVRAITAG